MSVNETNKPVPCGSDRASEVRQLDECGATTLEWAMLLAGIALPAYFIINICLNLLVDHYRMMTTLNALPFP